MWELAALFIAGTVVLVVVGLLLKTLGWVLSGLCAVVLFPFQLLAGVLSAVGALIALPFAAVGLVLGLVGLVLGLLLLPLLPLAVLALTIAGAIRLGQALARPRAR